MSSQISDGVYDKVALPDPRDPSDAERVGICSLIGRYPVEQVESWLRILPRTTRIDSEENRLEMVDPRFVLASPWDLARWEAAQDRVSLKMDVEPCSLGPIQIPGFPVMYLVSDGMHRCAAARLARQMVKAQTGKTTAVFNIGDLYIKNGKLYEITDDEDRIIKSYLLGEEYAFYMEIGIQDHTRSHLFSKLLRKLLVRSE